MKEKQRAMRRHNDRRVLVKRFKQELQWCSSYRETVDELRKWAMKRARKRLNTGTLCSCALCGSPRRTYGNGKAANSFQEQRNPIEFD